MTRFSFMSVPTGPISTCRWCASGAARGMPVTAWTVRSADEARRRARPCRPDRFRRVPADNWLSGELTARRLSRDRRDSGRDLERAGAEHRRRPDNPFLDHAFFLALEQSGCATARDRLAAPAYPSRTGRRAGRADAAVISSRIRRANMSSTGAGPTPSSGPAGAIIPSSRARCRSRRSRAASSTPQRRSCRRHLLDAAAELCAARSAPPRCTRPSCPRTRKSWRTRPAG